MPMRLRPIVLALLLAVPAALYGCGGSSGPDPSIPADNARVLLGKIAEIKANVDVGSCLVAAEKTNDLLIDIQDLPSGVNSDVRQALNNGANNLELLLKNPDKCEGRSETTTSETTTTPSTTEQTTTERTQSTTTTRTQTQPTTTTQTQPNTTTTPGTSGGIGPGGL